MSIHPEDEILEIERFIEQAADTLTGDRPYAFLTVYGWCTQVASNYLFVEAEELFDQIIELSRRRPSRY